MHDLQKFLRENGLTLSLDLLLEALTHPSILHEKPDTKTFERLETIGDAVLDLLVLDKLNEINPNSDPEFLTIERSKFVNNGTLAAFGKKLQIDQIVLRRSDYSLVSKDYADIVEALFGAIFVDQGYAVCKAYFEGKWDFFMLLTNSLISEHGENPIGKLQELVQRHGFDVPQYSMIRQIGSPHDPLFTMQVMVNIESQTLIEVAEGNNKQMAKVSAAKKLLQNTVFLEFQEQLLQNQSQS